MRQLVPDWEFTTANEEGDLRYPSLNDGYLSVLPDPGVLETNPWLDASCSFSTEAENFPDIFGVLPDFQLHETLPVQATSKSNALTEREVLDAVDEGKSSWRKRKADDLFCRGGQRLSKGIIDVVSEETKIKQDERPKRTRSAETHNMSARRRRDRMKGKMRALQELIPNCHKSDRASILDEAVEYLKALKLHVQMMSTGGGGLCQVSYMSPAGIQSTQIPQFSKFMDMLSRPGFGMGMVSTAYSTGLPMIPTPLPFPHPLPSAAAGFYLNSGSRVLPISQLQVPLMASQALPTNSATSTMLPQFTRELVTPFNHSNQGASSSQSTLNNFQRAVVFDVCSKIIEEILNSGL